jgi:hypothetical protein
MMKLKLLAVALLICFASGAVAGILAYRRWTTPTIIKIPVGSVNPATQAYQVQAPDLQPKAVKTIVKDVAEVSRLLREQAAMQVTIDRLLEVNARLVATGKGTIEYRDVPVPGTPRVVREATFADWRLSFKAVDDKASYQLRQRFEVLATTGKTAAGLPTAAVKLFELGPGEIKTPLTDVATTFIVANPAAPRWYLSPTVQAGVGLTMTTGRQSALAAIVGVRWLSRGSSRAAEDSTWALLSPVVVLTGTQHEVGILPVSVNLGRIPHRYQPFKDLWVAPVITVASWPPKAVGRVGLTITASF